MIHEPLPTDPMTPIPATISDKRNLIYHIWPTRHNDNWRWNVAQLLKRINLFNGVRSIAVATDDATHTMADVQAEFAGVRIDNWIWRPNNPRCREGRTFVALMDTMPRDDSVTCYAHAKGVRHDDQSITLRWADLMYRTTLDDWPAVAAALEQFPIVGTFKRYGQFRLPDNNCWHYSGTFFWFRNRETFARPTWSRLHLQFFASVEAWPANVYKSSESACLLGDDAGDLYQEAEMKKWEMQHAARLTNGNCNWQ